MLLSFRRKNEKRISDIHHERMPKGIGCVNKRTVSGMPSKAGKFGVARYSLVKICGDMFHKVLSRGRKVSVGEAWGEDVHGHCQDIRKWAGDMYHELLLKKEKTRL